MVSRLEIRLAIENHNLTVDQFHTTLQHGSKRLKKDDLLEITQRLLGDIQGVTIPRKGTKAQLSQLVLNHWPKKFRSVSLVSDSEEESDIEEELALEEAEPYMTYESSGPYDLSDSDASESSGEDLSDDTHSSEDEPSSSEDEDDDFWPDWMSSYEGVLSAAEKEFLLKHVDPIEAVWGGNWVDHKHTKYEKMTQSSHLTIQMQFAYTDILFRNLHTLSREGKLFIYNITNQLNPITIGDQADGGLYVANFLKGFMDTNAGAHVKMIADQSLDYRSSIQFGILVTSARVIVLASKNMIKEADFLRGSVASILNDNEDIPLI